MIRASQSSLPTPPDYDVRVMLNLGLPVTTNWLGVGGNYALIAGFPAYGRSAAQLTAEWDRVALSGVKLVSTWVDQSWSMPSYPSGTADWNTAEMTAFWDACQAMKDRGINVALRLPWHFPQNVGALSGAPAITPTAPQEAICAQWVSDLLHQAINVRGLTNITICQFFTEPNTQLGTIPGGYATPQAYYAHVAVVFRDKIVADDAGRTPIRNRITLIGPGEFSYTDDPWIEQVKPVAGTALDDMAWHTYFGQPAFAPFGWSAVNAADYQTLINVIGNAVSDSSPKRLFVDEGGFLTGDADPLGYRATADAGWQWVRQIDGAMQAGASMSWIWLLADQPILGSTLTYGTYRWLVDSLAVKPSWYAITMHANLTGGGAGTNVYRSYNGTSTVHATGVFVPYGIKNTVNPAGEWSFVLINEGSAQDVKLDIAGLNLTGRTIYKYTYSGEMPPAAAVDPAYLKPWDQVITGVANEFPTIRVPGKGFVILSTMNISAPTAISNLALTSTASATSTGFGAASNVNKNNPTNVIGARNSWRKANDSTHSLTLTWTAPVSIGRIELAFVGTTAGVVYGTGTDTTSPSPLADYTVEYFNGSSWTQLANVTGNNQPNRTHTFSSVNATAVRINVLSAAATGAINNVGVYAS